MIQVKSENETNEIHNQRDNPIAVEVEDEEKPTQLSLF